MNIFTNFYPYVIILIGAKMHKNKYNPAYELPVAILAVHIVHGIFLGKNRENSGKNGRKSL
ncbi:MAG: hypothetical protein K6D96_05740 [Acetatifactor sp.]|nr:hypothetical protein [Acetatifactor sp.]